ncbi:MAG: aspartate kinase [Clostridia bacterium]|nr:aspartate kinase [Clostridia bacterium]MBR2601073.1 aspartate kinase [Clostridia bacterium]MBR7175543.1 aspartate kinase [Clostridia bacterium]
MLECIVTKFGGSSLANDEQFRKVRSILELEPTRQYLVPSAPGKRFPTDEKVTDLLYLCYELVSKGKSFEEQFVKIRERYLSIAQHLHLKVDIESALDEVAQGIAGGKSRDWCASRGEYLCGLLIADYLGWRFVDAAKGIRFRQDGTLDDDKTQELLSELLKDREPSVVPGFYGAREDGEVVTFSRGGSDITGALVARAVGADVYENWTDVSGFLMADPRIIDGPAEISSITYKELRELSHMGASVLHEDAMFPVHRAGIPTNIRNTNKPYHPGTLISKNAPNEISVPTITGIAGHRGYSVINIEKSMMNSEVGFGRKVLSVLEEHGISFEHMPTGIDSMCVVVKSELLAPYREEILAQLEKMVENSGTVSIADNLSIIATVGRGMVHNCGTAARLFSAMSRARINVRMIDQGSSELSIIVGVNDNDFEATVHAIYHEFVG